MALVTELHVQAGLWHQHAWRIPVLYLEGEAPDRSHEWMVNDALLAVVRARGLRLTTDPDQLLLRPVTGWRIRVNETGAVTVDWPHFTPLLTSASIQPPDGWQQAANAIGVVVVFAGYGLGLHDPHAEDNGHAIMRLWDAAAAGKVAGGAITVAGQETRAAAVDGTITRPRRRGRHNDHPDARQAPRWVSRSRGGRSSSTRAKHQPGADPPEGRRTPAMRNAMRKEPRMAERSFLVSGIHCGGCANHIEIGVRRLDGVRQVAADPDTKVVLIDFDEQRLDAGAIAARLEQLGFPVAERERP